MNMNRYTVERRFRREDGTLGRYIDFQYAKGISEVRRLCGNIGRAKKEPFLNGEHTIYEGENERIWFKITNCGRWY